MMHLAISKPHGSSSRYEPNRFDRRAAVLAVLIPVTMFAAVLAQRAPQVRDLMQRQLVVHAIQLSPPPPAEAIPDKVEEPPEADPLDLHVPIPMVSLPTPTAPVLAQSSEIRPPAAPPRTEPASPTTVATPAQTIAAGDLSSSMIHAPPPRYPRESRRLREQGTVVLELTLAIDGRVRHLRIVTSSGHARLDEAARDAVEHWRWSPTLNAGVPVQVRGTVEIPFILIRK